MTEAPEEPLLPEFPSDMAAVGTLLELARSFAPNFQMPTLVSTPLAVVGDSSEVDRIRQAEARYQTLVEQIPAVTFMASFVDGLSEIYVSPHIETLLGYTAQEWIDDPVLWYQRLHPEDKQRWNEEFSRTVSWAEPFKADYRFLAKDGRVVWIHGEARVVRDSNDRPSFVQGIGYDITELKEAEEVLRRSREELETLVDARTAELASANKSLHVAIEEADRANQAKSEFLSRMSHELRTPLNAILGFGQVLAGDLTKPDDVESIDQVLRAGRHLLALINEVLDIATIEAGRMQVSLEPVALGVVIRETVELVKPLAAERKIQTTASTGEAYVLADRQRLKQVLLNLISNAIKYNCENGTVAVDFNKNTAHQIRVTVRDTGPGLTEEDIGKIFTPFERLRAAETRVEGTGLGLAVCQHMMELMSGKIGVESTPGEGSSFWFELPMAAAPVGAVARLCDDRNQTENVEEAQTRTILYIEDNLSNLSLLKRIIGRQEHITFLTATTGEEGFELAKSRRPELILLDLYLPGIRGDEVLQRLRAEKTTASIPVIMISADATDGQAERLLAAGAQSYMTKPLDLEILLGTIERTFREAVNSKTSAR